MRIAGVHTEGFLCALEADVHPWRLPEFESGIVYQCWSYGHIIPRTPMSLFFFFFLSEIQMLVDIYQWAAERIR